MKTLLLAAGLCLGAAGAWAQAASEPHGSAAPSRERRLSGSAEATAWCAWLMPATPDDVKNGVFAYYKVRPALMTGTAVAVNVKGWTHLAFEYLTHVLENEIRGKIDPGNSHRILLDYAVRYRPTLIQRLFDTHYLLTRVDVGKFDGTAVMVSTRDNERSQARVRTSFFLADLLWLRKDDDDAFGMGLRLTEHKLPSIVYDVTNRPFNLYSNPRLSDTRYRTASLVASLRDAGMLAVRERPSQFERKAGFYIHEIMLGVGYAEASNELMGNAAGFSTLIDLDGGIRRDWRLPRSGLVSASLGARSNLLHARCFSDGGRKVIDSRTWLFGPYARLTVAF
ncbi:MAG: hypothetical protein HZB91_04175 [Elusimicrobia bacterium]|nr:hypothetical protein [Elusimicrobiota bacterium]